MSCLRTANGFKKFVVYSFVIFALSEAVWAQDFGYEGRSGPEHWGEEYARCTGKHQSPININHVSVKQYSFPKLEFHNFNVEPKSMLVTNNGHTVLVKMSFNKGKAPRVRGGPLAEKSSVGYQFEQFHFHWGENDTIGSEDMIDNHAYPAELHVVLRNLEYPSFASALGKDHGIAVMAFFFQISSSSTGGYTNFTTMLPQIERKGQSVNMTKTFPLRQYLSKDLSSYYSYTGSLTTPPCSEEVIWMDFRTPIDITEKQLNAFRLLTAHDDHLKNNFRPTQPLNDRPVYSNRQESPLFVDSSAGGSRPLFKTIFLVTLLAVLLSAANLNGA
ncbi:hypothetical protein KR026_011317 [Drosophila bipectinata]|nr:hypothetical protein KR026_011317 [Drosophila bipectinata]